MNPVQVVKGMSFPFTLFEKGLVKFILMESPKSAIPEGVNGIHLLLVTNAPSSQELKTDETQSEVKGMAFAKLTEFADAFSEVNGNKGGYDIILNAPKKGSRDTLHFHLRFSFDDKDVLRTKGFKFARTIDPSNFISTIPP